MCDRTPHRFDVLASSAHGSSPPGVAQALTFADVTFAGRTFSGIDDDRALELVP